MFPPPRSKVPPPGWDGPILRPPSPSLGDWSERSHDRTGHVTTVAACLKSVCLCGGRGLERHRPQSGARDGEARGCLRFRLPHAAVCRAGSFTYKVRSPPSASGPRFPRLCRGHSVARRTRWPEASVRQGAWKCTTECEAGTPRQLLRKPTVNQVVAQGRAPALG